MNNEELRRKAFLKILDENTAYTQDFIEGAEFGLQACWQLFMPHIEILPEGYRAQRNDVVEAFGSVYFVEDSNDDNWRSNTGSLQGHHTIDKILAVQGKPCVYVKDLMGEYA